MIFRLSKTFIFCFIFLGTLNWCLTPSMSFAAVPLQEHRQAVSPPAIDSVGGADTKSVERSWYKAIPPGGRNACFPIEDRQEDGLEPRGLDGNRPLLLPLTTLCIELLASADDIGWSGYEAQGDHARSVGKWSEAEKDYAMAVGLLERVPGMENNLDLAALLDKLGATRFKQNDFAGAEAVFRLALTIYTSKLGSEDLRVADTLDLVAGALFEQRQGRALAGPLFFRAWVIRDKTLRPDHPAIADSLHHMAVSLYSDNLTLAISLFDRSREIREKVFGHNHPLVANSLNAMAQLYELHNRRDLAIPLYQDALNIQETAFGPNASETLQARHNLDMAYRGTDTAQEDPNAQ